MEGDIEKEGQMEVEGKGKNYKRMKERIKNITKRKIRKDGKKMKKVLERIALLMLGFLVLSSLAFGTFFQIQMQQMYLKPSMYFIDTSSIGHNFGH